jgi:hypothetical protein
MGSLMYSTQHLRKKAYEISASEGIFLFQHLLNKKQEKDIFLWYWGLNSEPTS